MPIVRLHNPRGRFTKRTVRRTRPKHRARRKNSLGEGVLTFMANPKRKHRASKTHRRRSSNRRTVRARARSQSAPRRHRRRSANPARRLGGGRRRRNALVSVHNRHHRRRNPAFSDVKGLALDAAYLAGGGVTSRSVPQLIAAQYNAGFLGYGLNLLTAAVSSALIGKWRGPAAARTWLLGGFAFTLSRILDDYAGLNILQFAQYNPPTSFQLAGDVNYGLAGVYRSLEFPLPSNSQVGLPEGVPASIPANGDTAKAGMGWDSSYN